MSPRRDRIEFAIRVLRALRAAGALQAAAPRHTAQIVRIAKALGPTPATPIAIGALRDPDGLALADEIGELSWRELDLRAQAIAQALVQSHGAGPGRPVALMCRNHRGAIEVLAAAARAGADVLALNTEFAAPQIAAALSGRNAALVVADQEFEPRLAAASTGLPQLRAWSDGDQPSGLERLARSASTGPGTPRLSSRPARRSRITILTSGTTGTPKAATRDLTARAMLGATATLIEHLGLRRGDPVLVAPPLFHGFGLGVSAIAHSLGAPVVISRRFEAEEALALIERYRVSCMVAVPVMLQRILALSDERRRHFDVSSLRSVLSGGAPLAPALATRFMDAYGAILHNGYGSTETGFGAIAGPDDLRRAPGTIGRAALGARIQILDADRRPATPGETGHIFVGGDLVFDGYGDGSSKEVAAGLMNTGDLGHVDAGGCFHVEGREDDMIVSGGENVFPQEVEHALAAHHGVLDVAIVGAHDAEFGQRLVAYVVPAADQPPTPDELQAHLRSRLERYKLPREIVFRREIPRTPTGKLLRRELG